MRPDEMGVFDGKAWMDEWWGKHVAFAPSLEMIKGIAQGIVYHLPRGWGEKEFQDYTAGFLSGLQCRLARYRIYEAKE